MTSVGLRAGLAQVRQVIRTMDSSSDSALRDVARAIVDTGIARDVAFFRNGMGKDPLGEGCWEAEATGAAEHDDAVVRIPLLTESRRTLAIEAQVADVGVAGVLLEGIAAYLALRLDLTDARLRTSEAERLTTTLSEATQALGRTLDSTEVLGQILDQLRLVVPYDSATVQLLGEDNSLTVIGVAGFPNPDDILDLSFSLDGHNPNKDVISTRSSQILKDAVTEYAHFGAGPHLPAAIRGWLGVPLLFHGDVLGMISVDSQTADFYDETHVRTVEAFAAQAAVAIANSRLYGEMQRLASHDSLTGLPNRRHLEEASKPVIEIAIANHLPLTVLMVDIDHFKRVNDAHGHAVGDTVLRGIAKRLRSVLRPDDLMARVGGEEFVVLLPGTNLESTAAVSERVRKAIADKPILTEVGELTVTSSIGAFVCLDPADSAGITLKVLLHLADQALYRAKAEGRNRTVLDATAPIDR